MLRRAAAALALSLAAVAFPSGTAAGGGAVFDFDRDYYVPGDRAEGQTVFSVSGKDRRLLRRTFYAYLIPGPRWIEPPDVPPGAVPIGTVSLTGLARVSFVVPNVAPGPYTVGMCDRPCRHAYVGDLMGGWITVVGSREEARLRGLMDRLERRLERLRGRLSNQTWEARRRTDRLEEEIAALSTATEGWERRQAWLETRLARLEREPQSSATTFDRAGWAVATLALGALAASSWRRRRPTPVPRPTGATARSLDDAPEWQLDGAVVEGEREPAGVG
jgi:hypothetical protein